MGLGLRRSVVDRAAVVVLSLAALLPARAAAQTTDRPGPFVVDVRATMGSLPQDASFFPPAPNATPIPTTSLGFDIGGHVYLFNLGPARIGLGANLLRIAGGASPPKPSGGSSTTPPPRQTLPDVDTRVRMFTPQLSFNFGSSRGWSYLSAGVGQISVQTTTSAFATGTGSTAPVTPARTRETAALQTINVGGGARWFTGDHLAFSFDVRFHKAAGRTKNEVSTTPVTLVTASAGISLK
ncbi:MAG: hypothetical protein HYY76_09840 [Acidobacteria bacterium]|nr:hypothetical protein [Acidobacteriota bacterium]